MEHTEGTKKAANNVSVIATNARVDPAAGRACLCG